MHVQCRKTVDVNFIGLSLAASTRDIITQKDGKKRNNFNMVLVYICIYI